MQFGFPKSVRLLASSEFDRVMRCRCSASDRLIVVYAARSDHDLPRIGLTVSRKVGNAVTRNRWKRSLREAFRHVQNELPREIDLVVLPRPQAQPRVEELKASLKKLAGLLADKLPDDCEEAGPR